MRYVRFFAVVGAMVYGCGDGVVKAPKPHTCAEASCDPVARCDDSSGAAVCACPVGYRDPNADGTICADRRGIGGDRPGFFGFFPNFPPNFPTSSSRCPPEVTDMYSVFSYT